MTTKTMTKPKVSNNGANGSRLKAVVPEKIEKRLKLFLYGPAGIGKTLAALQFPNAYIIDTERGAEEYGETIKESGSALFQSNDAGEIKEQLEALLTEAHNYRTLIIDPVTILYQSIQDDWAKRFEREAVSKSKNENADMQDFGMRFWGKVKSDYKAIQRLILRLDMNVITTAHQKDVYGTNFSKTGVTFDSMKGDDYFFDYVFRLEKRAQKRYAMTEKQRAEIGKPKFPDEFEWSYENFRKFYGSEIIEKKAEVLTLATHEDVLKINSLLNVIQIPQDTVDKWFKKADVSKWQEMTSDQIRMCIEYCEKKLKTLNGGSK